MDHFQTIQDIIPILPLDEQAQKILSTYPQGLSEDKQIELERLLWRMFYALYDLEFETEVQKAFADKGEDGVSPQAQHQIAIDIVKRLTTESTKIKESADIDKIRKDINTLIIPSQ